MFLVDTVAGRVVDDEKIKHKVASRRPYRAWVAANRVGIDELPEPHNVAQPDPAALLGSFGDLDQQRREAITAAESLKAQRNRLSGEIGKKKRTGEDATELTDQVRTLREQGESHEANAAALDARLRQILEAIPNLPNASVPEGAD